MKRLIPILLILSVLFTALPALGEEAAEDRITVSGQATVSLIADTATVVIGNQCKDETVTRARQKNAEAMDAIIAALKKLGVADKDIVTTEYSVYRSDEGEYGSLNKQERFIVSNMLSVTVRDLAKVTEILDAATESGANLINSLSFSSSNAMEAREKAMNLAMENARHNAEVLARAAGRELGKICVISHSGFMGAEFSAFNNRELMKAADSGRALVSGNASVQADVTVTFEMK